MSTLIIKTGSTFTKLKESKGDFEDWIIRWWKDKNVFQVWDIVENPTQKVPKKLNSVIITGSHSNVTDNPPWQDHLIDFLLEVNKQAIPILGICYGHQILAEAFGGKVDYHPKGGEFGLMVMEKKQNAMNDPLFKDLPDTFIAYVSHTQSVIALPEEAVVLASSTSEPFEAVRFREKVWGVQFHPEFDHQVIQFYFHYHYKNQSLGIFNSPDSVSYDIRYSQYVLYNFLKLYA